MKTKKITLEIYEEHEMDFIMAICAHKIGSASPAGSNEKKIVDAIHFDIAGLTKFLEEVAQESVEAQQQLLAIWSYFNELKQPSKDYKKIFGIPFEEFQETNYGKNLAATLYTIDKYKQVWSKAEGNEKMIGIGIMAWGLKLGMEYLCKTEIDKIPTQDPQVRNKQYKYIEDRLNDVNWMDVVRQALTIPQEDIKSSPEDFNTKNIKLMDWLIWYLQGSLEDSFKNITQHSTAAIIGVILSEVGILPKEEEYDDNKKSTHRNYLTNAVKNRLRFYLNNPGFYAKFS